MIVAAFAAFLLAGCNATTTTQSGTTTKKSSAWGAGSGARQTGTNMR